MRTILLLAAVMLVLAGCSGVMRPPSAVAFMNSYEKTYTLNNASITLYGGDLDNDERHYNHDIDMEDEHFEWPFDVSDVFFGNVGFFSAGFGFQTTTPFVQLGFTSPYIGVSAWSSVCLPYNENCFYGDGYFDNLSYGTMLIQQFPLGKKMKVGFTEHFSRNGSERYFYEVPEFFGIVVREPHPIYYREIGGGFFVTYSIAANIVIAIEFRYGRDIDFMRNRFAITVDMPFVFKKESPEEKQCRRELKIASRRYESLYVEMVLQKKKLVRINRAKKSRGGVADEEIIEEKRRFLELKDAVNQQKTKVRELKKNLSDGCTANAS